MAKWVVYLNGDGKLNYTWHNTATKAVKNLGTTADVDDDAIVSWWINKATPAPGDILILPGGRVVQLYPFNHTVTA